MSKENAFLVGFLNRETGDYEGCGIFGEETPTCSFKYFTFVLLRGYGEDFESAMKDLNSRLEHPAYSFLKLKLDKRSSP